MCVFVRPNVSSQLLQPPYSEGPWLRSDLIALTSHVTNTGRGRGRARGPEPVTLTSSPWNLKCCGGEQRQIMNSKCNFNTLKFWANRVHSGLAINVVYTKEYDVEIMGSITFWSAWPSSAGNGVFYRIFLSYFWKTLKHWRNWPTATCTLSINVVFPVSSTAVGFS